METVGNDGEAEANCSWNCPIIQISVITVWSTFIDMTEQNVLLHTSSNKFTCSVWKKSKTQLVSSYNCNVTGESMMFKLDSARNKWFIYQWIHWQKMQFDNRSIKTSLYLKCACTNMIYNDTISLEAKHGPLCKCWEDTELTFQWSRRGDILCPVVTLYISISTDSGYF